MPIGQSTRASSIPVKERMEVALLRWHLGPFGFEAAGRGRPPKAHRHRHGEARHARRHTETHGDTQRRCAHVTRACTRMTHDARAVTAHAPVQRFQPASIPTRSKPRSSRLVGLPPTERRRTVSASTWRVMNGCVTSSITAFQLLQPRTLLSTEFGKPGQRGRRRHMSSKL